MVKFAFKSHHARYYNKCFCVPLSFDNANLYKKSELYASFIKKLRPQPYIASRLFMLYAFFQ